MDAEARPGVPPAPIDREPSGPFGDRPPRGDLDAVLVVLAGRRDLGPSAAVRTGPSATIAESRSASCLLGIGNPVAKGERMFEKMSCLGHRRARRAFRAGADEFADRLFDQARALGVLGERGSPQPPGQVPVAADRRKQPPVQGLPSLPQRCVVDRLLDKRMAHAVGRDARGPDADQEPGLAQRIQAPAMVSSSNSGNSARSNS